MGTIRRVGGGARLGAVALGAWMAGCMVAPYDGQEVTDRSARIPMQGFELEQNREVRVEARDPSTGAFVRVAGPVRSGTTDYSRVGGVNFEQPVYLWSAGSMALADRFWEPGACRGWKAQLRAVTQRDTTQYSMRSVRADWVECATANPSTGAFNEHCTTGVVASVTTRGYADAGRANVGTVDELRVSMEPGCDHASISARIASSDWTSIQGRIRFRRFASDSVREQVISCTRTGGTASSTSVNCHVPVGVAGAIWSSYRVMASEIGGGDASLAIQLRATDAQCERTFVTSWTPRIYTVPTYRGQFSRCATTQPPPPPDPPPPAEGTWWNLGCICQDATAIAPVSARGCFDVGVTYPQVGAQGLCAGSVANELRARTGLQTQCVLDSLAPTSEGPCRPGDYAITGIGR